MKATQVNRTFVISLILLALRAGAQQYGLTEQAFGHLNGYVLFAPLELKQTFLINKCGQVVHSWSSQFKPGQSVYLLPNGDLLRSANDSNTAFVSGGGRIELFDWQNRLKWSYKFSDSLHCLHHDIYPMPNGHILALLWEKKSRAEAIALGRNPALTGRYVWNEKIIELKPTGINQAEIVWYWDVWEHLVQDFNPALPNYGKIAAHPEKININFAASKVEDWLHFNALVYDAENEELLISNRNFSEIYIIAHPKNKSETTTLNSDILYRWGNAKAYLPDTPLPQKVYSQHSPYWIPKGFSHTGEIMLFNNGNTRHGKLYSSLEIIAPKKIGPHQYLNDAAMEPLWRYVDTTEQYFYSKNVSNGQMLEKGHVLICQGASGRIFEIDEKKNIVWQYVNPLTPGGIAKPGEVVETNRMFRAVFYKKQSKALRHKKLNGGATLETNPKFIQCIPGAN